VVIGITSNCCVALELNTKGSQLGSIDVTCSRLVLGLNVSVNKKARCSRPSSWASGGGVPVSLHSLVNRPACTMSRASSSHRDSVSRHDRTMSYTFLVNLRGYTSNMFLYICEACNAVATCHSNNGRSEPAQKLFPSVHVRYNGFRVTE
jgi:hypothetical protein